MVKWNLRPQESQDGSPLQLLLSEDVFTYSVYNLRITSVLPWGCARGATRLGIEGKDWASTPWGLRPTSCG